MPLYIDETVAIIQMDSETEEDNEVCYQFRKL